MGCVAIRKIFKYCATKLFWFIPLRGERVLFDAQYYHAEHPEVRGGWMGAFMHYMKTGYKKGFDPSPVFKSNLYLEMYPDIKAKGINPLRHWVLSGEKERRASPIIKTLSPPLLNKEGCEILLFSHELSLTGAPRALFNMALALKKQGHSVFVLSPKGGRMETELRDAEIDYRVDEDLFAKLFIEDDATQKFFASFKTLVFNTIAALRYALYIKADNRKICWVHENGSNFAHFANIYNVSVAFAKMDEVYCVGEYSASFARKYCSSSKLNILLYGIPEYKIKEKVDDNKVVFSIFGAYYTVKGQDLFAAAIKRLPLEVRNSCLFLMAGPSDSKGFYNNIKLQMKAYKGVSVFGALPHDEMLRSMSQTDVVVCSSRDDAMPITCTEAAMMEKTVICSDKTGTASFIKDGINGYLFHLGEDDSSAVLATRLAKIIERAFNNRENLAEMGRQWRKVYEENFAIEVFKENVKNVFQE